MSDLLGRLEFAHDKLTELSINLRNQPVDGAQGIAEAHWASLMKEAMDDIYRLKQSHVTSSITIKQQVAAMDKLELENAQLIEIIEDSGVDASEILETKKEGN